MIIKKIVSAAILVPLLVSAAWAGGHHSSDPRYAAPADPSATPAGFGTDAKVALLWHWSEGVIRSVGVTKVSSGGKGVICITPKVALDVNGIFPIVSFSPEESNTLAGFAGSRNEAELCKGSKDIEVDTYESNGKSATPSNDVGFYLIIE